MPSGAESPNSPESSLLLPLPPGEGTGRGEGMRVVVVGGGLAGMAAAVALESAGLAVTLIEARKTLGGRAGSFEDPQTGQTLDNCQHVLLGCCTNLIDFYKRTGAFNLIRWEDTIRFIDPRGREHKLKAMKGMPAPLHLALSGLLFGALTFSERIAMSSAMRAMLRMGIAAREKLENVSFGDWLKQHNQPDSLIDKFYDLVLISALNEQCRLASASYAIQVFQDGLLAHSNGYRVGMPAVPLGKLYERFPCKNVRLAARMTGLRFTGNTVTGVELQGGEILEADAVVLAVNYPALDKWIPPELWQADERFAGLEKLQSVPILGAHLWFDRPILSASHAALMTTPMQWLFAKHDEAGKPGDGSAVHGVISAARDWLAKPKDECLKLFEAQVRATFPHARDAKLLRGVIVIEKRATFSPLPGSDAFRPRQGPGPNGIANLFLAGDYTRTGWPATMEGAVRGGYLAAEAILKNAGETGRFLVPDLKPQWPARFLGLK
jgi:squalene-associated FAD-dependent desaturase